MLKKILLGIVVIIAIFAIVVAVLPSHFRVTRSATISAPPAVVFALVNDFHRWEDWSPWAKLDPASQVTFEGAPVGKGAIFTWNGNDKVGKGRMTITESHPSDLIRILLEFEKPFAGKNTVEFTFKPEGNQTLVTWSMSGRNNFVARAVCLFMNMDKMIGGDYEKGLASMKAVAEAEAKKSETVPPPPAAPKTP